MSKTNGQAELHVEEGKGATEIHEPELPPADPHDGFVEQAAPAAPAGAPAGQTAAEPPSAADELQKVRGERDALLDRFARLQAEFENFRKRSARENADYRDYAVAEAARSLLPMVDSFSLALKNTAASAEDFRKGVELIYKQLQEALQKINVQRVPAEGQPFDPRMHEAIEVVESDKVADNHVLEELQAGYRIKDRLLRPAMVRVARKAAEPKQ